MMPRFGELQSVHVPTLNLMTVSKLLDKLVKERRAASHYYYYYYYFFFHFHISFVGNIISIHVLVHLCIDNVSLIP